MTYTQAHSFQRAGRWTRLLLRWSVRLVLVALVLFFGVMPLGLGIFAAFPAKGAVGDPPEGFTALTVTTPDSIHLGAWYAPSHNGAAIIVLPGSGGSRSKLREQATMLAANGFGVLALDPRGFGESDGQANRFGWNGTLDVGAAVDYLATQPDVNAIGGWGLSLGGEVLLGALGEYPQITAVIADGATSRSYDETFDLESLRHPVTQFHVGLTGKWVALFTGDTPPTPIMDSLAANETARLLLIAAGKSQMEIDYNTIFAATGSDRAEVWVVPDTGHTGGWNRHRDDYTRRVLDFFTEALTVA